MAEKSKHFDDSPEALIRMDLEKATLADLRIEASAKGRSDTGTREQLTEKLVKIRLEELRGSGALGDPTPGRGLVTPSSRPAVGDIQAEPPAAFMKMCAESQQQQVKMFELMSDLIMRVGARADNSGPSPHSPAASETGSVLSGPVIQRRFGRLFAAVTTKLEGLKEADGSIELEMHLQALEVAFKRFDDFFQDKVDFLDGEEGKDTLVEEHAELQAGVLCAQSEARQRLSRIKQEAEEDRRAGALAAGVEPPTFCGSPLSFPSWWEAFEAQVDKNPRVSRFYKMQYLKKCLTGSAASVLAEVSPLAENYPMAVELIKKSFGKGRVVVRHLVHRLINIEQPRAADYQSLRKLRDELCSGVSTLESHAPTVETLLVPLMESKLPEKVREDWERRVAVDLKQDEFATKEQFLHFLTSEVEAKEAAAEHKDKQPQFQGSQSAPTQANGGLHQKQQSGATHSAQALVADVAAGTTGQAGRERRDGRQPLKECPLCRRQPHNLAECQSFLQLSRDQRCIQVIIKNASHFCKNCLALKGTEQHGNKNCDIQCTYSGCKGYHHILWYHDSTTGGQANSTGGQANTTLVSLVNQRSLCRAAKEVESQRILPTAMAFVAFQGQRLKIRVGLDSFSTQTFVTKAVVSKLGAPTFAPKPMSISGFNGQITSEIMPMVELELRSYMEPEFCIPIRATVKNGRICSPLSAVSFNAQQAGFLQDLNLTEDFPHGEIDIDLLVGAEYFWRLVRQVVHPTKPGLPSAVSTPFGYVLSGPWDQRGAGDVDVTMLVQPAAPAVCPEEMNQLQQQVERFWSLENLGLSEEISLLTAEEKLAEKQFQSSVQFDGERYIVALPFRPGAQPLQNNYEKALQHLLTTEQRLQTNEKKREVYSEAINEYERLGFAQELTEQEYDSLRHGPCYFVPHHPVFKSSSTSTKVRIVFNASSPDSKGISLNQCLLPGPALQPDIGQVLLRFRCHRVAINADIKKMFCQTRICPEHYRYQLYLWRDCDKSRAPRIMAMNRVMFGVTSSPFLAMRAIRAHFAREDIQARFLEVIQAVAPNIYVDDVHTGGDSVEKVVALQQDLVELFSRGGWELTKFATNSSEVLAKIGEEMRLPGQTVSLAEDSNSPATALGLRWNTTEDVLMCNLAERAVITKRITKRLILATVSSIYDLFGFFAPFTI